MPYVTCSSCRTESLAPRELVGLLWNCPKCQTPIRVDEHGGDVDRLPPRRRRRKSGPGLMLVVGLVASGFLLLTLAFLTWRLVAGPSESIQGQNWTHADLVKHLNDKGLPLQMTGFQDFAGHPMASLYEGETNDVLNNVVVQLRPNTAEARETAAAFGEKGFAWGRFVFRGNPKLLERIRVALGA